MQCCRATRWVGHCEPVRKDSGLSGWATSSPGKWRRLVCRAEAIFLAPNLRFGVFGNPLEKTLCLFGEELLGAKSNDFLLVFGSW